MAEQQNNWHRHKHHHPIIFAMILIAIGFYSGRQNADVTRQDIVETVGRTLEATGEILIDAGDALKPPKAAGDLPDLVDETNEPLVIDEPRDASDVVELAKPSAPIDAPVGSTGAGSLLVTGNPIPAGTFHRTNQACIDIIKSSQEVRLEAYEAPTGSVLIGYGHARTTSMGMTISTEEAEMLLRRDLRAIEQEVADQLTRSVNVNEFSAMVCLAQNIGKSAFAESTVLKETNESNKSKAADAFLVWNKARIGGVVREVEILNQRRQAERSLYLK